MFSSIERPTGIYDGKTRESTVLYVFSLIWPQACLDCSQTGDCYLVGVAEGAVRHVVRVPCALVDLDQGMTLVRAVYMAGNPHELGCAPLPVSVSI